MYRLTAEAQRRSGEGLQASEIESLGWPSFQQHLAEKFASRTTCFCLTPKGFGIKGVRFKRMSGLVFMHTKRGCKINKTPPQRSLFDDSETRSGRLRLLSAPRGETQQAQTSEQLGVGFGFGNGVAH